MGCRYCVILLTTIQPQCLAPSQRCRTGSISLHSKRGDARHISFHLVEGLAQSKNTAFLTLLTSHKPGRLITILQSRRQHWIFHQWDCLKARQWVSALHVSSVGLSQGQAVGVSIACFISGTASRPGSGSQHCMFHQWESFKAVGISSACFVSGRVSRQWASAVHVHVSSAGEFQGQTVDVTLLHCCAYAKFR